MLSHFHTRKFWLTCGLLLGAALFVRGLVPHSSFDVTATPAEALANTRAVHAPGNAAEDAMRKIEEIEVGHRVVTSISDQMRALAISEIKPLPPWDDFELVPAQWRRIELTLTRDDDSRMRIVL